MSGCEDLRGRSPSHSGIERLQDKEGQCPSHNSRYNPHSGGALLHLPQILGHSLDNRVNGGGLAFRFRAHGHSEGLDVDHSPRNRVRDNRNSGKLSSPLCRCAQERVHSEGESSRDGDAASYRQHHDGGGVPVSSLDGCGRDA